MRIYANDLPGHRDVSIDGGHLLKVVDRVVNRKHTRLLLDVSNGRVEWRARRSRRQFIESRFLFSLHPGSSAGLFVGLNRVIAGDFRAGSGLCRVLVSLFADRGQSFTYLLSARPSLDTCRFRRPYVGSLVILSSNKLALFIELTNNHVKSINTIILELY